MVWRTAIAGGNDWRVVSRLLLAQLPELGGYNIAFLYVTDDLAPQAQSLFNLLRRITKIPNWIGGSNLAAFCEQGYLHGEPGAVLMLGRVADGSVNFPEADLASLRPTQGAFGMVHGDPRLSGMPRILEHLAQLPNFLTGGLMLNRGGHHVFRGTAFTKTPVAITCFDERVAVASALFHGCCAFGKIHQITSADASELHGLDHRPAMEIFAQELTDLTAAQGEILGKGDEIHIGIMRPGCDNGDYAVRGLNSIDPHKEFLNVATHLEVGQNIRFVQRDRKFAHAEMQQKLAHLMARLERARQKPVAAHYVSCMGRVPSLFNDKDGEEMDYLRAALGDIPIIGYYGIGEIMRGELHNFAGVLTVFVE